MELNELFKIMKEKGYHYFSGNSNSTSNCFGLDFSTGYNGRGKAVFFVIKEATCDLEIFTNNAKPQTLLNLTYKQTLKTIKNIPNETNTNQTARL